MTTYVESATGVTAGGRTGLTALVVALLFLLCLWFAPLTSSIPLLSTAPALIIVGSLLLAPIKNLPWDDPIELIPCFVVLIIIPLTFSISSGIALGLILFPLCKLFVGRAKEVHWLAWILGLFFIAKFVWMD
jgi:AGZA family xanthine/uracil permease-like MFS transporter